MTSLTDPGVIDALCERVVGRRRELEVLVAALAADRHVLLEGPPGTGKSTILREVAAAAGTGFVFVEGNAELTPARLAGQFDPSRVLEDGYTPDVFVDGPLVEALRNGSLLYVEELNRVPEETVNLLITVMSEGELTLPRLGTIPAATGFRLVAAMNPFDNIGTARVSGAVYDRMCRIAMGYQSLDDESDIVVRNTSNDDRILRRRAVAVTRGTRTHPDVRVGSSVRGAIDLVEVGHTLAAMRGTEVIDPAVGLDAALTSLSGRVRLHEGGSSSPESVISELWEAVLAREKPASDADDPEGKAGAPGGATPASP
ncbi:MAG: MoxR family ATPase [Actinomycetota bacterium]